MDIVYLLAGLGFFALCAGVAALFVQLAGE